MDNPGGAAYYGAMFGRLFGGVRARPAARVAAVPSGYRVFAIGDVHGRIDLLMALEAGILDDSRRRPHGGRDVVIYLGDYVDRGPASAEVIEHLARAPLPGFSAIHLLGNHDEALLRFLADAAIGPSWATFGGEATLVSYVVRSHPDLLGIERYEDMRQQLVRAMPVHHVEFLRGLKTSVEAGDYLFAHAGIRPGVPLPLQRQEDLLWIREAFLDSELDHGKVVVHGHTPTDAPVVRANRIGIDTGAFASGVLTCLALEGDQRRFIDTGRSARTGVAAQ